MPDVWERIHETVLDNELRKAHKAHQNAARAHGRWMWLFGFAVGFYVALVAF